MKRKSLPTGRDFLFVEGYGNENPGAFQSPRPLRGATLRSTMWRCACSISTHAPLAGRDLLPAALHTRRINFNPRAPCGARQQKCTNHYAHFCDNRQISDVLRKMPTVRAFCFFFVREKRENFSANRPSDLCALVLRTIRSSVPRADTSACSRSVRFYSRTSCPSSKIEGCPFLGQ